MKTSERRARADRALIEIEKLEMEIRAQMVQHNIQEELDEAYTSFKAYSVLRDLHQKYAGWKEEYNIYADNVDLVNLVGQSEHDILRENLPKLISTTEVITVPTTETVHFYERNAGTGQSEKVRYKIVFEKVTILPFHISYVEALDSLFVRVNLAGIPT